MDGLYTGNDLNGQDEHAVAKSLSPCTQRGRWLFSIVVQKVTPLEVKNLT